MTTYQSTLVRGQTAWFIRENKVVSMPVGSVTIKSVADENGNPSHETVTYGFRIYDTSKRFKEWEEHDQAECFGTKEELLASL